jgi:hypothetical protein
MLILCGCDKTKRTIEIAKDGYSAAEDLAKQLVQVQAALRTNDYSRAKEMVRNLDQQLNTRSLTWTVQVLSIEHREGVGAATSEIQRLRSSPEITKAELSALDKMAEFYNQKGTVQTGDLVAVVALAVVFEKYGNGGGGQTFELVCNKLGLLSRTNSTPARL